MHPVLIAATFLTAACAAYSDMRHRRIFNWLTLGMGGAALVSRLAIAGGSALLAGAEGWLLGIGVLLIPFALGWMGAGDVKLLGAFGALGGPLFVEQTTIIGCVVGAAAAIAWLAYQRQLRFTLRHFVILLRHPNVSAVDAKQSVPFGAALSAGAVASVVLAGALI